MLDLTADTSTFDLALPDDLFQDRDAVAAIRAAIHLPDVARTLSLRVGLFQAAAMVSTDPTMRASPASWAWARTHRRAGRATLGC
ncbi:hypothetical protein [Jannaschia sp. LMIT008]|uniref:hypothetical protein n=1 Tax=Jannaschia maritima TaxID=3032585 RepID=UPI0028125C55|nr:hypothetical protein [Jannaschia sp. LMIT008]